MHYFRHDLRSSDARLVHRPCTHVTNRRFISSVPRTIGTLPNPTLNELLFTHGHVAVSSILLCVHRIDIVR